MTAPMWQAIDYLTGALFQHHHPPQNGELSLRDVKTLNRGMSQVSQDLNPQFSGWERG